MRKFLIHIVAYSSIIILILAIGEIVARRLPTPYSYKDHWITDNGHKVRDLVMGTSHTYYGVRPDIYGDSTFNLANISQTPEYDLALLKHYLHHMPNLKRIIMPISYFTFRDPKIENGDEWMLAIRYKTQMHLPLHSDFSIFNLEITDFDAYKGKLKNLILKAPSNKCDSLGFGLGYTLSSRDINWKEKGAMRSKKHTLSTPGRYLEVKETFDKIIKLAKKKDIDIVFITTPAWTSYTEALDSLQLAEMYAGIADLLAHNGVLYYDFLKDNRFSDADFYDPDHLSDKGAEKLSRILADTIKAPSHNISESTVSLKFYDMGAKPQMHL